VIELPEATRSVWRSVMQAVAIARRGCMNPRELLSLGVILTDPEPRL